jgi:predicted transposase YdaD
MPDQSMPVTSRCPTTIPADSSSNATHRRSPENRLIAVFDRIKTVRDPERRRQLVAEAAVFANINLDRPTILELLRRYPTMPLYIEEMPFYEDILERGLEQGLEQGREQGREQGEAHVLARILQLRLPEFGDPERASIASLNSGGLDRLTELALTFKTITELRAFLYSA